MVYFLLYFPLHPSLFLDKHFSARQELYGSLFWLYGLLICRAYQRLLSFWFHSMEGVGLSMHLLFVYSFFFMHNHWAWALFKITLHYSVILCKQIASFMILMFSPFEPLYRLYLIHHCATLLKIIVIITKISSL